MIKMFYVCYEPRVLKSTTFSALILCFRISLNPLIIPILILAQLCTAVIKIFTDRLRTLS